MGRPTCHKSSYPLVLGSSVVKQFSSYPSYIDIDKPGHSVSLSAAKVLDRESEWFEQGVKEAIYIRSHNPSLNRDGGRQ